MQTTMPIVEEYCLVFSMVDLTEGRRWPGIFWEEPLSRVWDHPSVEEGGVVGRVRNRLLGSRNDLAYIMERTGSYPGSLSCFTVARYAARNLYTSKEASKVLQRKNFWLW